MKQSKEEIEEELLMIKEAKKNPEVFGFLYEKYYRVIFLFVNKRIDNKEVSADLVSQVFLKAMNNLHSYKFKGVPFSSWLFRIASNQVNDYFRKSKNVRAISLQDYHISHLTDQLEADGGDVHAMIVYLLNQLSEEEVSLLELRFFEERSHKEVAYIMGISETNAKVKTHRVIEKLRKLAAKMPARNI